MVKPPQGKGRRIARPSWRVVLKDFGSQITRCHARSRSPTVPTSAPRLEQKPRLLPDPRARMEHGQLLPVLPGGEQSQGIGMSGRGPPARLARGEQLCLELHMEILSFLPQKGKLEDRLSWVGNAPSSPSSPDHSQDRRPRQLPAVSG